MSKTPSKRRREGAIAFNQGASIEDNPYRNELKEQWFADDYANDWDDGWKKAQEEDEALSEEQEYWVTATYPDGTEEQVGSLDLRPIHTCHDMPIELEIDGVIYKPQF